MKRTIALAVFTFLLMGVNPVSAQLNLNSYLSGNDGAYSQNFDGMPNNLTTYSLTNQMVHTFLPGWFVAKSILTSTGISMFGNSGGTTAAGLHNYGNSSDRAIGSLNANATGDVAHAVYFFNNTGFSLTNFTLTFTAEVWRAVSAVSDKMHFSYKISSSPLSLQASSNTTWGGTALPAFDFTNGWAAATGAANGNLSNRTTRTGSLGIGLAPNEYLMLRWLDSNNSGTDPGMSLDDMSLSFQKAVSAPSVSTVAASATNTTTATLNGNVTADGGDTVTGRGVCYKTTAGVTISDNQTASGSGTGAFSANLTSLSVNQQYFFVAYAINSAGTTLGSELSFTTLANTPSAPTVGNPSAATLDVTVNVNGNPAGTTFAIQRTSDSLYVQGDGSFGASAVWQTAAAWGTKTVTGLSPSTLYTFQVKARNGENVETAFGSTASGTTSAGAPTPTPPTVNTPTSSSIGSTTATLGGNIASTNNAPVTERGVFWHTSSGFTPPGVGTKVNEAGAFGNGTFTVNASGLPSGSTVYFVAYASNSAGSGYSSESSFTTIPAAPVIAAASAVAPRSFSANWSAATGATNYLLDAATDSGYSSPVPGFNNLLVGDVTTYTVTGLSPNVTYYFRLRAESSAGVSANSASFQTNTVATTPELTTTAISAITTITASSGGNVTNGGGLTISARGVCWNTTGTPTTGDATTSDGTGTGAFSSSLTGLTPGQTYYVRSYAVNSLGTAYGNELSFIASCFSIGPTGLYANPTNTTDFTANWSAVSGATAYRVDVATNSSFPTGAGGTYVNDDFESGTISGWTESTASRWGASATTPINGTRSLKHTFITGSAGTDQISYPITGMSVTAAETTWRMQVKHGIGASANNNWAVFLMADQAAGQMTPAGSVNGYIVGVNYTGSDDLVKIWKVTAGTAAAVVTSTLNWDASVGTSQAVGIEVVRSAAGIWSLKLDANGGFDNLVSNGTPAGDTTFTTAGYLGVYFEYSSTGDQLLWVDDMTVSQAALPAAFMPGYSNRTVGATSVLVTGLSQNVTYYYRVRAEGAGSCVSPDSSTASVTTPSITPVANFNVTSSNVTENTGTAVIPITINITADATVQVARAAISSAALGSDFTFATTNIVFVYGGPTISNVIINVIDDSLVEGLETAVVQMVGGENIIAGSTTNFVLAIADNEPSVQFTASSASVSEGSASYTVTVYKSSVLNNVSGQVELSGSAILEADYSVDTTNFTLNGGTTSATFVVSITNDSSVEIAETVILTLNTISGASTGTPSVFTLTINNDDCAILNTIAFQGFEGEFCDTWFITNGAGQISSATGTGDSPANGRIRTGGFSWQSTGGSSTLELTNISIAAYNSVTATVRIAAAAASAQGMETTDRVQIYVSLNNGPFPATPDVTVVGTPNNNARWGFDATSIVNTVAGFPVAVTSANPVATASITNVATANIIIPDGYTTVRLRIVATSSANETWVLDDIQLSGLSGAYVDTAAPSLPNFSIPGTNDGILAAGFNITGQVQDAFSGVIVDGSTPYIFILDPNGGAVEASNSFDTAPVNGSTDLSSLGEAIAAVAPASIVLGTHTATVGAVDALGNASVSNFTFDVVDDDIFAPLLQGFYPNGQVFIAGTFDSGIPFTGQVRDSNSGLLAITNVVTLAPRINLFSPSGVQLLTNAVFTNGPPTDGAFRNTFFYSNLAYTASASIFTELGTYTAEVAVTDSDNDRPGDSLTATTSLVFTISGATISFGSAVSTVSENGGVTNIAIIASSAMDTTVQVAIAGTASPGLGNDYTNTTTNIVFDILGSTTQFIIIAALNDATYEGNETVVLSLANPSGASLSSPSTHTLSIIDDDCFPRIAFQGFEGDLCDTWSITNSVTGSTSSGASDTPANARILNGTKSWQVNNSTTTLELGPVNISAYQSITSSIRLSASSTSGGGLDSSDNIKIYVSLNNGPFPATPDIQINGFGNTNWTYSAVRTAATTSGAPITVSANPNGIGTATIVIPDGYATVRMRIVAVNDASDEYWNIDDIALDGIAGGGDTSGPVFSGVNLSGYTTNDAGMAAGFSITGLVVDTASGVASNSGSPYYFILNNLGAVVVASNGFDIAPVNGGALSPTRVADTFAGVTPTEISLGIYTATMGSVDSAGSPNATVTNYTFTVVDDDSAAPVLSGFAINGQIFALGNFSGGIAITGRVLDAGSGVYAITNSAALAPRINLFTPSGVQLLTNAVFTNGPAAAGSARTAASNLGYTVSASLFSELGVHTAQVSVTDFDADRTGDALTTTSNLIFTISQPTVQFLASSASISEGGSFTSIYITVSSAIDATVQVAIAGTAIADVDYNHTTTDIVFSAGGSTTASIIITPLEDALDEGSETVELILTNANGLTIIGATATNIVTLTDNDGPQTVWFQGFEGTGSDNWSITAGGAQASNASGSGDTPATQRIRTGSYSWQVSSASNTLDLSDVSVAGITAMTTTVHLTSTAGTSGNGAEDTDVVRVYVALNGAAFSATPDVIVLGNNNARWAYNASGVGSTTAGSPITVQPAAGGNRTTDGYATLRITIPNGTTSIKVRVIANNNSADERWNVDDISLTGTVPAPGVPTVLAATAILTTSFQANWSAASDATSYRLDVSSANNFGSFVSGFSDLTVTGLFKSVTGLSAGQTYYYRVRAYNITATSGNSTTSSVTLPATATVAIQELPATMVNTSLSWSATVNALYDVYYSDSDPGGAMTWNLIQQVQAAGATEAISVTEDNRRYFKVVIAGASPTTSTSPIWGVIKPTIPTGYSMMAAPLDITDLTLNGEFGTALAEVLDGDNGGNADYLMIRESNGSWTTIYLDGNNDWSANYTFAEGQGFYIYRSGSAVTPRFTGPVGNDGGGSRSISTGWNIIGPSQGKNRSFTDVTTALVGTPTGGWEESTADLIVIDEGSGNFRRIMKYNGSPAWLDLKTFSSPNVTIQPGQGIYYMKQGSSGVSGINL